MKFELNLPNFLSFLRILALPFIFYFLNMKNISGTILAMILLLFASLTDTFDGILARKLNQASEFGAFFDPLADKVLIWGIYIIFLFKPFFPVLWPFVLLIILRDIYITFLRYYSKKNNIAFKTSSIAKAKTAIQMIFAFILMFFILLSYIIKYYFQIKETSITLIWQSSFPEISNLILFLPFILMFFVSLFTVLTGVDYFFQYLKSRRKN